MHHCWKTSTNCKTLTKLYVILDDEKVSLWLLFMLQSSYATNVSVSLEWLQYRTIKGYTLTGIKELLRIR